MRPWRVAFPGWTAHAPHPVERRAHPDRFVVVEADDVEGAMEAAEARLGPHWGPVEPHDPSRDHLWPLGRLD